MLIHLTPRIYNKYSDITSELIDFSIPYFDLILTPGVEIMIGRPYPNKCYGVISRKVGQKAMIGILIDVDGPVSSFVTIARWLVDGVITEHVVNMIVNDQDFDCITDDPLFWYSDGKNFKSRWLPEHEDLSPVEIHPTMHVLSSSDSEQRKGRVVDLMRSGMLAKRTETLYVPTIEKERLFSSDAMLSDRMPKPEHAFKVTVQK